MSDPGAERQLRTYFGAIEQAYESQEARDREEGWAHEAEVARHGKSSLMVFVAVGVLVLVFLAALLVH